MALVWSQWRVTLKLIYSLFTYVCTHIQVIFFQKRDQGIFILHGIIILQYYRLMHVVMLCVTYSWRLVMVGGPLYLASLHLCVAAR